MKVSRKYLEIAHENLGILERDIPKAETNATNFLLYIIAYMLFAIYFRMEDVDV